MKLKSWVEDTLMMIIAVLIMIIASEIGTSMTSFIVIRLVILAIVILIGMYLKKYGRVFEI